MKLSNMKLGTRIWSGFGIILLLTFILGGIAVWNMKTVSRETTDLASEYVPGLKLLTQVERQSLQAMSSLKEYALSQDETCLKKVNQGLEKVQGSLQQIQALVKKSKHLDKLKENADDMTSMITRLLGLKEKTVAATQAIAKDRNTLEASAAKYMQACSALLEKQNQALKKGPLTVLETESSGNAWSRWSLSMISWPWATPPSSPPSKPRP